ncbi:MAG: PLP-dependent aminotransferase family protein [Oscillospiraceae bacterium]|nr:PLP-dependent aminotransferase family protein [Oscillospiraceae bacterium]
MLTYDLQSLDGERKYYALYQHIKEDIVSGVIPPGDKLPSKRALASHLGVSTITVEYAYRQLIDEGYIYARERSGYYVCQLRVMASPSAGRREPLRLLPEEDAPPPEGSQFPYSLWFRTLRHVMSEYGQRLVSRSPNQGCAVLRNAIAAYLLRYRGMYAQPEQIIVGSGSEQLYETVVRMLGTDRIYGLESPSYGQIQAVYQGAGAQVEQLPMGPEGIISAALTMSKAQVLHVTPFHSYPSGVTAPAAKRYEYLQWAAQPGRYIVEDDFDSEFFMPGKPLESLYSMDKSGSVIYLNTFSKSLAPSMRMGYMILPPDLLPVYTQRAGMYSCSVPVLEQYALAEFMNKGYFEQHLNRTRRRNQAK